MRGRAINPTGGVNFTCRFLWILPVCLVLSHCSPAPQTIRQNPDDAIAGDIRLLEVPYRKQEGLTGCGAAVLASVMAYWGTDLTPSHIRKRYPAQEPTQGYTLGEMKQIAVQYGFHAFAIPSDFDFIQRELASGRPVIVPLEIKSSTLLTTDYDHYVVVLGLDRPRRKIYLLDPQAGLRELPTPDFARQWQAKSNALLLVSP